MYFPRLNTFFLLLHTQYSQLHTNNLLVSFLAYSWASFSVLRQLHRPSRSSLMEGKIIISRQGIGQIREGKPGTLSLPLPKNSSLKSFSLSQIFVEHEKCQFCTQETFPIMHSTFTDGHTKVFLGSSPVKIDPNLPRAIVTNTRIFLVVESV